MVQHIPVLLHEVLEKTECSIEPKLYLDCTFGRGGHASEIMKKYPNIRVDGIDQDHQAHEEALQNFKSEMEAGRLKMHRCNFMELEVSDFPSNSYDLILADLGVSSPQYDQAERGFSFYHDGPLDMRMDQRKEITAADIINGWSEEDLMHLFKTYGEHRNPYKVVKAIVHDRKEQAYTSTRQLASMIERVEGWRKKGSHPATKFFMALRLEVNQELEPLENCLEVLVQKLNPGGRLLVITFHSLEDRIVKHKFKALKEYGNIINKKVIQASDEEIKLNPRSRTAKLRVFERGIKDEQA